jgi:uncharacterized delta-60 repeat protein
MKMFGRIAFLITLLLTMMSGITYAAPGDVDTSFNPPNGFVTYDGGNVDYGYGVALQPDGKIVVAGYADNGPTFDILVFRYNPDGSLDGTFGTGGIATYDSGDHEGAWAVALQPDGKIVVAGVHADGTDVDVLVVRFNPDGSLDGTFGTGGAATYDGEYDEYAEAVALQPDGKIVVAGYALDVTEVGIGDVIIYEDVLVLRYNPDGSLDDGFGTGGVVTYDGGDLEVGLAVAIQPDGKIVVAGAYNDGTGAGVLVLRYNPDGSLDGTFGTGGVATYNGALVDSGWAVALQPDGKIVVAGYAFDTRYVIYEDVLVLRYNPDGSLDGTFGTGGVVTYDGGNGDYAEAVALQPDGKIVVAGYNFNGTDDDIFVVRFMGDESGSNSPNPPKNPPFESVDWGKTDGSPCFIATAAYGSSIDPHVNVLREFRDRFLLNDPVGRALVDFYYEDSPPLADFIAVHPSLRAAVRWSLMPLIGLAWMVLHLGPTVSWLFIIQLTIMICTLGLARKRGADRGGPLFNTETNGDSGVFEMAMPDFRLNVGFAKERSCRNQIQECKQ